MAALAVVMRNLPWASIAKCAATALLGLSAGGMLFLRKVLERTLKSLKVLPPTETQKKQEDLGTNPLFRAMPQLRGRLAWRQLGENFPSPVHRFSSCLPTADGKDREIEFWVKREDLCSRRYGGNKVRTLQYQLASAEAHAEASRDARFLVFGSGGSNQVVATKVHAAYLSLPADSVVGMVPIPDPPELDNTLNYLSSLSIPGQQMVFGTGMGSILAGLGMLPWGMAAWVFMPGGNGPLGVLGQVGGAIELAEQIERGELPDPDGIVVALGSGCTTTGLILGVAAARAAGLKAFQAKGFRIYVQPVHPVFAKLQKFFGFLKGETWPMTLGRGIKEAAAIIADNGGPDLTLAGLAVMRDETEISTDLAITGEYGVHSEVSKAAKLAYDKSVRLLDGQPHLWLCGHFTAKSFALLLKVLGRTGDSEPVKKLLFWQTKSAVQPQGPRDEWASFNEHKKTCKALATWAVVGGITGHPSMVNKEGFAGSTKAAEGPDDYRHLFTRVQFPTSEAGNGQV